jgi:16S rRNA processing protein RimM
MGRVMAPYGVQGWIKARAFTALPDGLLAYPRWWLAAGDGQWREFAVRDARIHSDSLVARLEGLDRREQAALWRGAAIGVPRALLPRLSEGEFYLRDLVGLAVVNRSGVVLGCVSGFLDTRPHPVLRVAADTKRGEGERERLIPLVPAYVDAIDVAGERIVVDWQSDY